MPGRRVLAAFEPVPHFGLGLVAKIDMAEINQRYLRAGAIAALVSLAAVLGAALLFLRVGEPMIRRLRESESRYRELFDNMDMGVAVCHARSDDGDFILKDFNRAGEHIAQINRRELIGRSLTEMFPGVRDFGLIDVLTRVSQTGKAERLPTRYYRDGRIEGWRDVYVYRLPSGEFITLFSDVSERERQAQALRQSEERYRSLVEGQPDPICQFLPDTTLTFVNRAYAQFYGTEPEELIGRRWLDFAPKDERPRFLEELSSFTPEHPERHEETRSTRADREVRWYLCHLYGFFDDAGKIVSFQTFGTDITARKRTEEQLARAARPAHRDHRQRGGRHLRLRLRRARHLDEPGGGADFRLVATGADGPKAARRHSRPLPGRPSLSGVRMPAQPCLRDRRDAPSGTRTCSSARTARRSRSPAPTRR